MTNTIEQEPVACMYVSDDGECEEIGHLNNYNGIVPNEFTPLYTKPQPTQPQTVKDALEQAIDILESKISSTDKTPISNAINEIKALIQKKLTF